MPPMTTFGRLPETARPRDLGLVLVAAFGLAACLTQALLRDVEAEA
jgi:hypothetical protein